tara:strand:+ start:717 stop:1055 length:339 start_codon:yes stop_codon:yes gene_type:complete
MKLKDILFEVDYWTKFESEANELENDLKNTYNRDDIDVTIIQHSNGDHARGKVTIRQRDHMRNAEYQNMKNYLTSIGEKKFGKGFKITGGANFYDYDDDSESYPDIKFEFET